MFDRAIIISSTKQQTIQELGRVIAAVRGYPLLIQTSMSSPEP